MSHNAHLRNTSAGNSKARFPLARSINGAPLLSCIAQPDVQVRRILVVALAGNGLRGKAEEMEQAAVPRAPLQGPSVVGQYSLLMLQEAQPGLWALRLGLQRPH